MDELDIALSDYTATVNSGKYADDIDTLRSKFPELEGYEQSVLDDYVATNNSGNYDAETLKTKFPELYGEVPVEPKGAEAGMSGDSDSISAGTEASSLESDSTDNKTLVDKIDAGEVDTTYNPDPDNILGSMGDGGMALKDRAAKSLQDLYKKSGVKDYEITDEQITAEAVKLNDRDERIKLEEKKYEDWDWFADTGKLIKANTHTAAAGIAGLPNYFNKTMFTLTADEEQIDYANSLSPDDRENYINAISFNPMSNPFGSMGFASSEKQEELTKKAEKISSEITHFDSQLADDFNNGDYAKFSTRLLHEGVGSTPSLVQAMIPYVGIASIVAGSSSNKQEELENEGYDLGLDTTANAAINGAAEGLLEIFTKKLGGRLWKSLKATDDLGRKAIFGELTKNLVDAPLQEGTSEAATALIQNLSDMYVQGKEKDFNKMFNEMSHTFLVGAVTGGGLGVTTQSLTSMNDLRRDIKINKVVKDESNSYKSVKDIFNPKTKKITADQAYIATIGGSAKFDRDIKSAVKSGELSQTEADAYTDKFNNVTLAVSKTKGVRMTADNRVKAANLVVKKDALIAEVKTLDDALAVSKKAKIESINEQLAELSDPKNNRKPKKGEIVESDPKAYKAEEVEEVTDAKAFVQAQATAISNRKEDKLQVAEMTEADAQAILDGGGKLFMTNDGKAGAYVKKDGYMGGLFKDPTADRTQAAKALQEVRTKAGGKFFDAFGTHLEDIYIKNGFRPVARMTFNEEYAPEGWKDTNLKTKPDNVFFVYDPDYKAKKGEGERIEDYDAAYKQASDFVSDTDTNRLDTEISEFMGEPTPKKTIQDNVENAKKALSKIAPDVMVVLHETNEAYVEATGSGNSNGQYNPNSKIIDINLETANSRTVAHEVFHAVLSEKFSTDAEIKEVTDKFVQTLGRTLDTDAVKELNRFASMYNRNPSEEALAELTGMLADNYTKLSSKSQSLIKQWLDTLAKKLGLKQFTDSEVVDLLNTIANKTATGEAITESDINILGVTGTVNVEGATKAPKNSMLNYVALERFPENDNTKVTREVPIKDFEGKTFNVIESDRMTGAFIPDSEGKPLFKFLGGIYFPVITGKWWASSNISKATQIANAGMRARDKDGYIYTSPVLSKAGSHMSNRDMFEAAWQFMKHDLLQKGSGITKGKLLELVDKAFSLRRFDKGRGEKLKQTLDVKSYDSIKTVIKKLDAVMHNSDLMTFDQRVDFVKSMLGDPKKTDKRNFPSAGSFSEFSSRFEETDTKGADEGMGNMVMVMRTKGDLKAKETPEGDEWHHKSYPAEIYSTEPIEVLFFDGAYKVHDIIPEMTKKDGNTFSWDEYNKKHSKVSENFAVSQYVRSSSKLGFTKGEVKTASVSKLQKATQGKTIKEVIKFAKSKGYSNAIIEVALTRKGFNKSEIESNLRPTKAEATKVDKKAKSTIRKTSGQVDQSKVIKTTEAKQLREKMRNLQKGSKIGAKAMKQAKKEAITELNKAIKPFIRKYKDNALYAKVYSRALSAVNQYDGGNKDSLNEAIDDILEIVEKEALKRNVRKNLKKVKVKLKTTYGRFGDTMRKLVNYKTEWMTEGEIRAFNEVLEMFKDSQPNNVDFKAVEDLYEALSNNYVDRIGERKAKELKEEETFEEKYAISNLLSSIKRKFGSLTPLERDLITRFLNIKPEYYDNLTKSELRKIQNVLLAVTEQGIVVNKVLSDHIIRNNAEVTAKELSSGLGDKLIETKKGLLGSFKSLISKRKGESSDVIFSRVERVMLQHIDSVIKNFKGTTLYSSIVHPVTSKMEKADKESNQVAKNLSKLIAKAKSSRLGSRASRVSSEASKALRTSSKENYEFNFQVITQLYLRQKEYNSNPDFKNKKVFSVKDHIDAMNRNLGNTTLPNADEDAKVINDLFSKFSDSDGNVDLDKVDQYLTKEEKKVLDYIEYEIRNAEAKTRYTNDHLKGESLTYLDNYFPRKSGKQVTNDSSSDAVALNRMMSNLGVKAGNSNERVVKSADPLDFNTFGVFVSHIRATNLEYNLTEELRTMNKVAANMATMGGEKAKLGSVLSRVVEGVLRAKVTTTNSNVKSRKEKMFNVIKRKTFNKILIDPIKMVFWDIPSSWGVIGVANAYRIGRIKKANKSITKELRGKIMAEFGSVHTERFGSRSIDIKETTSSSIGKSKYHTSTPSRRDNMMDLLNKNLISDLADDAADMYYKVVDAPMAALWSTELFEKFKALTGVELNEGNYDEMKVKHAKKFAIALSKADKDTSNVFNTATTAEQKLSLQDKPSGNILKFADSFMKSFAFNESSVFWDSVRSFVGKGSMSKEEAARNFFIMNARGVLYSYLSQAVMGMIIPMMTGSDFDDDEIDEINEKAMGRAIAQHGMLIFMGNYGNLINMGAAYLIESMRELYIEGEGDTYNPYEDSLLYSIPARGTLSSYVGVLGAEGEVIKVAYDGSQIAMKIMKKYEENGEITKEDLIKLKVAGYSMSLISQLTGLSTYRLGKLVDKSLKEGLND